MVDVRRAEELEESEGREELRQLRRAHKEAEAARVIASCLMDGFNRYPNIHAGLNQQQEVKAICTALKRVKGELMFAKRHEKRFVDIAREVQQQIRVIRRGFTPFGGVSFMESESIRKGTDFTSVLEMNIEKVEMMISIARQLLRLQKRAYNTPYVEYRAKMETETKNLLSGINSLAEALKADIRMAARLLQLAEDAEKQTAA